jgi:hypothetical protein
MANELSLFKGGVPSFLKNAELDAVTKALMGSGGSGGKRISIKGSVFRMIANGEEVAQNEDRAMNVVIVNANPNTNRAYYVGKYKEGENASPVCWSDDGKKPDPIAPQKQCSTCADCDQNIKGSGEGESKACRYSRKLAVVLDGDMSGDVYQLALPATSIFGKGEANGEKLPLEAYVRYLASHNVPVTAVITEMRFDTKSPVPKLTFKPVRGLTEEEWEICREQSETDSAKEAIKHTFTVKTEEKSTEAAPKKLPPKAEPEDDEPEPVKVSSKKEVAPPADDKKISSLLDEWSDD